MKKKSIIIFSFLMTITFVSIAQIIPIDLAIIDPGEEKVIDYAGEQFNKILITNAFPRFTYQVDVKLEIPPLDPIELPEGVLRSDDEDNCTTLLNAINSFKKFLMNGSDEKDIKDKIEEIDALLNVDEACTDEQLVSSFQTLKESTRREISLNTSYKKERGKNIVITISREDKFWKFIVKGAPIGQWLISYGFGVNSLKGQNEYFAKNVPDTTTFQITKKTENDTWDLEYTPTIFFSFLPYQRYDKIIYFSPSGGLGFDTESPVIFLGGSAFYRQNLGISAGLAFKKRASLKGIYKEGDTINENLEVDQLHDQIYRPVFFFSINFRFSENPFSKSDEED